jgi:glycerophosphoryl diester phosphodiesterase
MYVNVWTVNKEEDIRWAIQNGVDYITTDDPMLVQKLIEEMCK